MGLGEIRLGEMGLGEMGQDRHLLPTSSCLSVISLHKITICHKFVVAASLYGSASLVYI